MQLDVEVSPPAFVRAQLEVVYNCSVPGNAHAVLKAKIKNFGPVNFGPVTDGQTGGQTDRKWCI